MIRNPRGLESPREIAQLPEVAATQRIGGPNRHRHAMHRDWIVGADTFENFERAAARDHKILGYDLEPIYFGTGFQDVAIVLTSEPDAVTEHREVGTFHLGNPRNSASEEPARRHSDRPANLSTLVRSSLVGLFAGVRFSTGRDAFLIGRCHHVALTLAGILPLAASLCALTRALALARVAADALDLWRRRRAGTIRCLHGVARENQRDGRRQHRAGEFSLRHSRYLLRYLAQVRLRRYRVVDCRLISF